MAVRGFTPEQYAYRGDPHRYSASVRKALGRGKPDAAEEEVTRKDELEVLGTWSDYDSP